MIAILGSLIGLVGGVIPKLISLWQQKQDNKQELAILALQIKAQETAGTQRLEEIRVQGEITDIVSARKHDKPTGIRWIDGLRGTVRPFITYGFFALYVAVKIAQYNILMSGGGFEIEWTTAVTMLWQTEEMAIFATIISFWFSGRLMDKMFNGKQ